MSETVSVGCTSKCFLILLLSCLASNQVAKAQSGNVVGNTGPNLAWDYDSQGNKGPANWGNVSPTCNGDRQSPINFPKLVQYAPKSAGPQLAILDAPMNLLPTNVNFKLDCSTPASCGKTTVGGVDFTVAGVHLHAPSEHTLDGRRYPLEAHIVHTSPDGSSFAVVAVMFDYERPSGGWISDVLGGALGALLPLPSQPWGDSPLMAAILSNIDAGNTQFNVPLNDILDPDAGFCAYDGSLTTPPCTEAVTFYMSTKVMPVSERQVFDYRQAAGAGFEGNSRPLQPRNGRTPVCYLV